MLKQLSARIKDTLVKFLPRIRDVQVQIPTEKRYRALRRTSEVLIDDGMPTLLQHKGDGVQSLAALALMRHASERLASGKNLVVAIEEPESHLHPSAMHELRRVLNDLSHTHQLVLTTHNPLFVDRTQLKNNIVVLNKKARPAKSIDELRELLGVRASDNLRHADLILVVEGEDDRIALKAFLAHVSPTCAHAMSSHSMAIETLSGGSNLAYKVGLLKDALCSVHCLLDNDRAGRDAFEKARKDGLVTDLEVNWAMLPNMSDTEIEDLYRTELYSNMLAHKFGVVVNAAFSRAPKKKWSERMRLAFQRQGKQWDDRVEAAVKQSIAELVAADPASAIDPGRAGPLQALAASLERRISEIAG